MNKKIFFIIVTLIILIGGTAFLILGSLPPIKHGEEVNLEKAKELSLWYANKSKDLNWKAVHASEAVSLKNSFFDDYYFVYVWSALAHTENRPVAVNQKGSVFILPEDFDRLLQDKELDLFEESDIKNLIEFYLGLNNPMPDLSYSIIDNIMDIPYINPDIEPQNNFPQVKQQEAIDKFSDAVEPFQSVLNDDGSWEAEFYTWQFIGGVLERWNVEFSLDIGFISERETLGVKIGDYSLIL